MVPIVDLSTTKTATTTTSNCSPMASGPVLINTAKQLTLLLAITMITLCLILWLTEFDEIHCNDGYVVNQKLISSQKESSSPESLKSKLTSSSSSPQLSFIPTITSPSSMASASRTQLPSAIAFFIGCLITLLVHPTRL